MKARNTTTHRLCPQCKGEGCVEDRSPRMAPWEEGRVSGCDFPGCEDGWVRFRDEDPLETLSVARKRYRSGWPTPAYAWNKYLLTRRRAYEKVLLPPDDPLYYQGVRDAEIAVKTFRLFGLIRAAGGML